MVGILEGGRGTWGGGKATVGERGGGSREILIEEGNWSYGPENRVSVAQDKEKY